MKKFGILILPTVLFFYASMTCVYTPSHLKMTVLTGYTPPSMSSPSFETENASVDTGSVAIMNHNIPIPDFIRGIYLTNNTALSSSRVKEFIEQAKKYNINTFVIDVQKKMVPAKTVKMIKEAGIFPVARVVVFLGGLKTEEPDDKYIDGILDLIDESAVHGFQEVQLDYIRYADDPKLQRLPLSYKYKVINAILAKAQKRANLKAVYLSADIFGRITLNRHDHIGQQLENFSKYIDTIYPMLYPSHYTGDPYRISHPYDTVKEGVANSLERCDRTRVVAYIQGFGMKVEDAQMSLTDYIYAQMKAVDDAGGHGWVIWNAKNNYSYSYAAIVKADKLNERKSSGKES